MNLSGKKQGMSKINSDSLLSEDTLLSLHGTLRMTGAANLALEHPGESNQPHKSETRCESFNLSYTARLLNLLHL